jgi:hypothetical protein
LAWLVGIQPPESQANRALLPGTSDPSDPFPIHEKHALGLLHSLWWWQLPSQSPGVDVASLR